MSTKFDRISIDPDRVSVVGPGDFHYYKMLTKASIQNKVLGHRTLCRTKDFLSWFKGARTRKDLTRRAHCDNSAHSISGVLHLSGSSKMNSLITRHTSGDWSHQIPRLYLVDRYASDRWITGSIPHYIPPLEFFEVDLSIVILTHNSLKAFVAGIFTTAH